MSSTPFVETFRTVTRVAAAEHIRLTKAERTKLAGYIAAQAEIEAEIQDGLEYDGTTGDSLLHRDPTGEAAIRNILTAYRDQRALAAVAA